MNIENNILYDKNGFFLSYKYLAGLIDADGNIYVDFRKSSDDKSYAVVRISIAQKFPKILFNIEQLLNLGSSRNILNQNVTIFEVTGQQGIKLLNETANYMITKKSQANYALEVLRKYNNVSKLDKTTKIEIKKKLSNKRFIIDNLPNEVSTEWLAGYLDGDGCFLSEVPKNSNKLRCRSMTTIDGRNLNVAKFLQKNIGGIVSKSGRNVRWTYEINSNNLLWWKNIVKNLNLKRDQLNFIIAWIDRHPTHKRNTNTRTDAIKAKAKISQLKSEDSISIQTPIPVDSYQKWTRNTAIYPFEKRIEYLALGLSNEVGEVNGVIKKMYRDNNGVLDKNQKQKISDEMSDVLWYCARLCDELNLKMSDVMNDNIKKLESRKERGVITGSGDNR